MCELLRKCIRVLLDIIDWSVAVVSEHLLEYCEFRAINKHENQFVM